MHQETLELTELKAAHALTPYPSDFEAFWKARMEEADNAPLSWQIVPSTEVTSTALAHFFDLTFVGIDGAEFYNSMAIQDLLAVGLSRVHFWAWAAR